MAKGLRSQRLKKNKSAIRYKVFEKVEADRLEKCVQHEKERNRFDLQMQLDPKDNVSTDQMEISTISSKDKKSFKKNEKKDKSSFNAYGIRKSELKF